MEIEKKYLVRELPANLKDYDVYRIEQGYLCNYPTLRIRKCNEDYILTYKRKGSKSNKENHIIVNDEVELELNETSYLKLREKIDYNLVVKDRYAIPLEDGLVAEMDIFKEQLSGLVLVEVEFKDEQQGQDFIPPSWFGEDVSEDSRYRNVHLATLKDISHL